MPRFPDYDAEIGQGLQLPVAGLSEVPPEAAAYQARIARQNAFDDEERFSQRRLQRQAELDEAAGAMPPGATGFAAGVMRSTQKGDSALLAAISPANRPAFATRLAADREALLGKAAVMEQQGRARYEAGELDNAFAINEQDVARDPSLLATARQAYFGLVDSSGQTPAQKAQRRQDAERGFAIAAWHSRFADDPEAGAAALGGDDAAGGTSGDPAFAAIPKAEHSRLIGDAFLRRDQSQALARGALEPMLRDAETALTSTGRYDAPLPDETRFVAAYGREDGPRRHDEFQRIVKLGADVDAIKAMTPAEQTAWLARFAPKGSEFTGNGPDFAEGRERHARAVQAIALNLAARHKNPNAYVRAVYPALDKLWSEAESSPDRLKAALAATNAAMDGLGLPAQGRAVLPKAMIDKALTRFGDTARPLSERIAPFRALITAPDDPAQQANLFAQAMLTGLPRLAAPALAAYGRGEDDNAARLLAAAFDTPASQKPGQPADSAASAAPTSPLALRGGADATSTNSAWRPAHTDTAIDLGPAMTSALTRMHAAGPGGFDPLTAMLYDRLVQRNLSLNGSDLANAHALARQDLRLPGPTLYAQILPKTLTDAAPGSGSANDNGGAGIQRPATATPAKPLFEIPQGPGKPANVNNSPTLPPSPGTTVDNAGRALVQKLGAAPLKPGNDNVPRVPESPVKSAPVAAPPGMRGANFAKGTARGNSPLVGLLLEVFNGATDVSAPYPGTVIPRSFVLPAFGGVKVSPEATHALLTGLEKWTDKPEQERSLAQAESLQRFKIAASDALRRTAGHPLDYELVSTGGFDFILAPGAKPGEPARIVMARWTPAAGEADLWLSLDGGQPSPIPRPPQTAAAPYDQAVYDSLYTSSRNPTYAYTIARTMQAVRQAGQAKPGSEDQGEHQPTWETRWFIPEGDPALAGIGMPSPDQQRTSPLGTFGIVPAPTQPPNLPPATGEDGENGPEPLVEPLPPSPPDQPFFPSDYYAARKAGLTRQQALNIAIGNYRNRGGRSDADKGGSSPPTVPSPPPRPPQDPSDPYDEAKYDSMYVLTGSPRAALKAAKDTYRSTARNKNPDGSPTPTMANKERKGQSYPPPPLNPDDHIDMADYTAHRNAGLNASAALEAARTDLKELIARETQGGAVPTATDRPEKGQVPKPVTDKTPWYRLLRGAIIQGYADWTVETRRQQIATGKQPTHPEVTTAGIVGNTVKFSMNQKSRFDYNDPNQDTLAANAIRTDTQRIQDAGNETSPNEKMADAHGEVALIQKFADAGQTKGRFLHMVVNGRDVCGWCMVDIARAATAAELEGLVIYETATGNTKYWHYGMGSIKRIGDVNP
ncbi:cytidine deaminase-like fold-containing protein [Labrys neptuniae]|uniref:Putative cytidine deaminase C-terminal domain-containing protein n=1 Tax=Labrys neptuniae TaxID=376174 RepID=A0ABV3PXT0_9HYPH